MRIVTEFPRAVEVLENVWIPLADGARLACRIWRPVDAEMSPVPAILEYIPYRKRDFTTMRDEPMHGYFAGHGYAGVRVDMRGSGDSDGIMTDEYLQQELTDAVEVIAWLAAQAWCNGSVGMMGNSWGGFNALQVAALRPPALKAIITSCSTDNRYTDDMHYMGGCLLNDNLDWGTTFFSLLPRAPDPALSGDAWRDLWIGRLEAAAQPIEAWLRHQAYNAYWKHGSVCEDYGAISAAVFAVGGWLDGYSNAIPRLLANLNSPRLGLIGPWAHMYPHQAVPGPAVGFLQEAVRWWDHWLKGKDTGIMDEPVLRAFMGAAVPAQPFYAQCPGRWIAEREWPSPRIGPVTWGLSDGRLVAGDGSDDVLRWRSPQISGLASGEWCPYGTGGRGPEFPGDQREDDGRSLSFTSEPLAEAIEILGAPRLTVHLSVDRPVAYLVARLCDVAPDGASTRVSYGVLNLCHRDGHEEPAALSPGRPYTVILQLNDAAYSFQPGHRIRLALSNTYWPMLWPSPETVTMSVFCAESRFELPVRPTADGPECTFAEPESGPPMRHSMLAPVQWENTVTQDLKTGLTTLRTIRDEGFLRLEATGLEIRTKMAESLSIREGEPLSAATEMSRVYEIGRGEWRTRIEAAVTLTGSAEAFVLGSELKGFEGDTVVRQKSWSVTIPRRFL